MPLPRLSLPSAPLSVLSVLALAGACTGNIGDAKSGSGGSTGTIKPDAQGNLPYMAPQPAAAALPARAWRLTHAEYRLSVKNVTGIDVDTSLFEPEADSGLFLNLSNVNFVRINLARNYQDAAEQVADMMTDVQLRAVAGAACPALGAGCKADFIRNLLARAYRRTPAADEITEAGSVFDTAVAADPGDGVFPFRAVVQAALTSPFFLYRTEIGAPGTASQTSFRMTDHEVASFLSYSVLGQSPPAALLAAADRGELTDPATLRTNVDTLLAMPEAAAPLRAFLFQWLTLTKVNENLFKFPDKFPGFDAVRSAMIDEANAFFTSSAGMSGSLRALLTTPVPAPAGALATFYGAPGAGLGTRTGWLGLGGFLSVAAHADQSSPTLRGTFVRERLLCQHITIPQNVPVLTEVEQMGGVPKSTRDLYIMHQKAECAACHDALDGVGFTFENFDGAGRFRTEELFRNQTTPTPIDASGKLVNTDVNRPLANHTDLAMALADSAWVRECASIQAFRYYFGFGGDVDRGVPPVMAGYQTLTAGGTMKDLLGSLVSSSSTFERVRN
jgi:hypothetical protein